MSTELKNLKTSENLPQNSTGQEVCFMKLIFSQSEDPNFEKFRLEKHTPSPFKSFWTSSRVQS